MQLGEELCLFIQIKIAHLRTCALTSSFSCSYTYFYSSILLRVKVPVLNSFI
jgi:hypothetical protein